MKGVGICVCVWKRQVPSGCAKVVLMTVTFSISQVAKSDAPLVHADFCLFIFITPIIV